MNQRTRVAVLIAACAVALSADTVALQSGKKTDGTLLGANARQLDFLTSGGELLHIPIDDVASLTFSSTKAKAAQPARSAIVIPAGSLFRVRTLDPIDIDATKAGSKFRASLDDPIVSGGSVIVARGAAAVLVATKVEQGGKFKGSDLIQLKMISVAVDGKPREVVTSLAETKSGGEGKKTTRKVAGGAGLGAIVGGIVNGGVGAGIGALAGAAGGTIIAASGEPHLKVPPETRLEFQLVSDWKIR